MTMNQTTQSMMKITTCGLSVMDETLLRNTLSDEKSFFGRRWVIDHDNSTDNPCAVMIVDVDSPEGRDQWQALGDNRLPVRAAYTDNPSTVPSRQFTLAKPLWSGELMIVMVRAMARLNETLPRSPTAAAANQATAPSTEPKTPVIRREVAPDNLAPGLDIKDRFKLNCWPDFKKFDVMPKAQVVTLLSRQSQDINTLTRLGRMPRAEIIEFINRCYELGYLEINSGANATASAPPTANRRSLFQKIRNRLGL